MDFKEHEDEFKELVEQLVKAGNSVEEAQDIAEDQIDGYIMDGKYTEFDPDEADEVVAIVTESLDNLELEDDVVDVRSEEHTSKLQSQRYISRMPSYA